MPRLLLSSRLLSEELWEALAETLDWIEDIDERFPEISLRKTRLDMSAIRAKICSIIDKSENFFADLTEVFEGSFDIKFIDIPHVPLSRVKPPGSQEFWQEMSGVYLRDYCVIIENSLAVCLQNFLKDESLRENLIAGFEQIREELGLKEVVYMNRCYFEGGNVFVMRDLNGMTCVLQGAQPGGNYNWGFTDADTAFVDEQKYKGIGLFCYRRIVVERAKSANAAFRSKFGCSSILVELNQEFKDRFAKCYVEECSEQNSAVREFAKGKEHAFTFQFFYYHLDLYMHVVNNQIIIMNKNMLSKKTYSELCAKFGEENIIDLGLDIERIIKTRPVLNIVSFPPNKIVLPKLEDDLYIQAAHTLEAQGYEVAQLCSSVIPTNDNTGGGIHCITLQHPEKPMQVNAPSNKFTSF